MEEGCDIPRGGGNCTEGTDDDCGEFGFCSEGICTCVGRWTGEYCDVSFETALKNNFLIAIIIFLVLSIIFLLCSTYLLFLGRFQVRRRPLWVYYQHLSSVLLFFAAVSRTSYFSVNIISYQHNNLPQSSVTMECLFGVFFPLLVSVTGLQLLIWAEIAKSAKRKRVGQMFHVFNFTLFLILVVALALLDQIQDPRHLKYLRTIWRSYVVFVLCVQLSAFGYYSYQAIRGCQFSTCFHPDPLQKQIATFTVLIIVLLTSVIIVWAFDTFARWDMPQEYGPEMWLIFLYFYQVLEFLACLMLCFMMYSMFPPLPPSPFPGGVEHDRRTMPPMEWTENPTIDEVRGQVKVGEATPLNRETYWGINSQPSEKKEDKSQKWKDEQGNEMPFAWDVDDVNYSTYFLGRLANQDEDSTDDPLAAAIENDFEDFFENRHYDDSFRNYWAV